MFVTSISPRFISRVPTFTQSSRNRRVCVTDCHVVLVERLGYVDVEDDGLPGLFTPGGEVPVPPVPVPRLKVGEELLPSFAFI